MQLIGLHDIIEFESMRDHAGDIDFACADPLQGLARAGVVRIAGGVHDGFGVERLPEELQVREAHPLEARHAEEEDEAVIAHDVDRQRDRGFFAGGFDHYIGQCAAVERANGILWHSAGIMQRICGPVASAVGEAICLQVEGDDFGGAALAQGEIEIETGRALSDDGDRLAADIGQGLGGVEHGAQLLRLYGVLERDGAIDGKQVLDRRQVVFGHGAVIGRQRQHVIADVEVALGRVDGVDNADHFVTGIAGLGGIALVRQVVQMTRIAAAEREAQRSDQGVAGAQGGHWGVHEYRLAAGDDLHGFHGRAPAMAG